VKQNRADDSEYFARESRSPPGSPSSKNPYTHNAVGVFVLASKKISGRKMQKAIFGAGCFWCSHAAFERIAGVENVTSGYAGGQSLSPDYESVCSGLTGHAEVVAIDFDETRVSFRQLLEVLFAIHDPTTLNRQGADVGTQYRSVVFFTTDEQAQVARAFIAELESSGAFSAKIVTEISPAPDFFPAEDYHQAYFRRNPGQGYCSYVVAPKLKKLHTRFAQLLKQEQV
jgi:peptide-methionine (S)-S-oxide reductase